MSQSNRSGFLQSLYNRGWPSESFDYPVEVYPGIWLSGIAFEEDVAKWCSQNGFTHILNAAGSYAHKLFYLTHPKKYGINYLSLDIEDTDKQSLFSFLPVVYNFMEHAADNKGKILVHCIWGQSRSVSCIIYYLMKKYNLTYETSLIKIRQVRKCANPNSGFVSQLKYIEAKSR